MLFVTKFLRLRNTNIVSKHQSVITPLTAVCACCMSYRPADRSFDFSQPLLRNNTIAKVLAMTCVTSTIYAKDDCRLG